MPKRNPRALSFSVEEDHEESRCIFAMNGMGHHWPRLQLSYKSWFCYTALVETQGLLVIENRPFDRLQRQNPDLKEVFKLKAFYEQLETITNIYQYVIDVILGIFLKK